MFTIGLCSKHELASLTAGLWPLGIDFQLLNTKNTAWHLHLLAFRLRIRRKQTSKSLRFYELH